MVSILRITASYIVLEQNPSIFDMPIAFSLKRERKKEREREREKLIRNQYSYKNNHGRPAPYIICGTVLITIQSLVNHRCRNKNGGASRADY